jgi:glycosyltransferase
MLTNYNCFGLNDDINKYKEVESNFVLKSNISTPLITVLIPTYKRPYALKRAIDSVLKQIDFIEFEILIIDNDISENSETEKLVKNYLSPNISYYKNLINIGQIGNWNKGFLLARSEWVVLLHDDDYILPQFLSKISKVIRKNPEIQGLFTVSMNDYIIQNNSREIVNISKVLYEAEKNNCTKKSKVQFKNAIKKFIFGNRHRKKQKYVGSLTKLTVKDFYFDCGIYAPTGGIYKKSNVIALGGFSEKAFPLSDWDFHIRYINKYNLYVYFEELLVTSIGINESLKLENRIGFIEKGYIIRKEIKKQINTNFGDWWIQITCWRHAIGFHSLKASDISHLKLNKFYSNFLFKYLYFLIVFIYSRHLKFYVPLLETKERIVSESKCD